MNYIFLISDIFGLFNKTNSGICICDSSELPVCPFYSLQRNIYPSNADFITSFY